MKKKIKQNSLYLVITEKYSQSKTSSEIAKEAIKGGVDIIQMREKNKTREELYVLGQQINNLSHENKVTFIVNDDPYLAKQLDADGVHLGQEDIKKYSVRFVRELLGEDKIIGVSTHSVKEFETFQKEDVDYLAFGPIFETKTKNYCIGTEKIESIVKKAIKPVVFIGGINLENINQVIEKGGKTIGVIREIVGANNIEEATRKMKKIINQLSSRA